MLLVGEVKWLVMEGKDVGEIRENPEPHDAVTETPVATTVNLDPVPSYVLLDFSFARDVYQYRSLAKAEVVWAVHHTFGEDETRKLIPPRRRDLTVWTIETDKIELYQGVATVRDAGENPVASVLIKSYDKPKPNESGPRYAGHSQRQEGDLLLTLDKADTRRFQKVTDDEITRMIVNLGIGKIKRGVQPQFIPGTRESSGNKFLVLGGVKEEDKLKIPQCFEFPEGGGRMWINFKGKPRKCKFCGKFHDPSVKVCPMEEFVRNLDDERANCDRSIKTYSDSTLRLARQGALTCDVDAMSGGATGNLLNAIEVDTDSKATSVILVSGQNELNRRMSNEDFLWSVHSKEKRLRELSAKVRVAVLAPPAQDFIDPESLAREELFHTSLKNMETEGTIRLWINPIEKFDMDNGRHPSEEQTRTILRFMHEMCLEYFDTPLLLPSAVKHDAIVAPLYSGVNSLYKFGCASCSSRERNKWYNHCSDCDKKVRTDERVIEESEKLLARADEIYQAENPNIDDVEMHDMDLTCEECAVTFNSSKEIRDHFNSLHPNSGVVPRNKRKRRNCSTPLTSVPEDDDESDM